MINGKKIQPAKWRGNCLKKQAMLFEQAMKELPKRMMILGYDDYEECWRKTIKPAETAVS